MDSADLLFIVLECNAVGSVGGFLQEFFQGQVTVEVYFAFSWFGADLELKIQHLLRGGSFQPLKDRIPICLAVHGEQMQIVSTP